MNGMNEQYDELAKRCRRVLGALAVLAALFVSGPQLHAQGTTRPVIDETAVPVEAVAPVAADGHAGTVFLRKPPGDGPFPAVILIHGGAEGWEAGRLRDYALHTHASRFLEAGYVVATITRRDLDLSLAPDEEQAPVRDALAVFDYLQGLSFVDPQSIVVRGTSVGGYLALEVGFARPVAAIMVEEPFSFPFLGVTIQAGGNQAPDYGKLAGIHSPMLLVRGDQTPNINNFNRDVFIPGASREGKSLKVLTYPGELHSFAFYDNEERTPHPAVSLEVFREIDGFFRQHLRTRPVPLDPSLVRHETIVLNTQ